MSESGQEPQEGRQKAVGGETASLGRYRVIASIGSGGMADVFLAVTQSSVGFNKLVVVKRMRANLSEEDSAHVRMFLDEARLAARLNHPNVVHTYEVGTHDGMLFMVMEYLEGQPLKRILSDIKTARVPTGVAIRIVCDVLAGLHYAHELADFGGDSLGVVHRDVSPHNILVTYDGAAKVLDFGIAKASLNSTRTEAGVFKGKANYMAPEQALASNDIDRRADIFASGILLWELVTGERLFPGSPMQAMHSVVSKDIPLASSVCQDVDEELSAIIARALAREPDDRYQTAEAMRQALESHALAKGLVTTHQSVREFLLSQYREPREQIRKRIDDQVKSLRASGETPAVPLDMLSSLGGSLPAIEIGGAMGGSSPSNQNGRGTGSAPIAGQTATITSSFNAQPTATRVKILAVVGLFACAAVGLGLFIGSRRTPTHADAPVPAISPAPQNSAPAPTSSPLDAALVAAPAQGSFVTLVSDPTGANVELDGKPVGTTPLGLPLSNPGSRVVFRMSKDGYQPATVEVTVPGSSDKPAIASLSLKPVAGKWAPKQATKPNDKKAAEAAPPAPEPPPAAPPEPKPTTKPASTKPSVMTLDDVTGKPKVKVVE